MPKPVEYANSKLNEIDGVVAANVSIVPNIGPTHGVHPIANAKPNTNDIGQLDLKFLMWNFFSLFKELIFVDSIKNIPKMMIIIPAIMFKLSVKSLTFSTNTLLIKTPKVEKTIENPKTKNIVFAMMLILFI